MRKVSFSPSKTPVKVYNPCPNDFRRECRVLESDGGPSQINLLEDINQDFLRHFTGVVVTKRTLLEFHKCCVRSAIQLC